MSGEGVTWIVLGDPGISYGPMTEGEARAFAAQVPSRIALTFDGARSQVETCVQYGLHFKPLAAGSASPGGAETC